MPDFTGLGNHSPYFASNSHFVRLAGRVTPCAPVARRRSRTGRTSAAPGTTPRFPAHPLAVPALAAPYPPLHPLYTPCNPPVIPLYCNRGGLQGVYRGITGGVEGDMARPRRVQQGDGLENGRGAGASLLRARAGEPACGRRATGEAPRPTY